MKSAPQKLCLWFALGLLGCATPSPSRPSWIDRPQAFAPDGLAAVGSAESRLGEAAAALDARAQIAKTLASKVRSQIEQRHATQADSRFSQKIEIFCQVTTRGATIAEVFDDGETIFVLATLAAVPDFGAWLDQSSGAR